MDLRGNTLTLNIESFVLHHLDKELLCYTDDSLKEWRGHFASRVAVFLELKKAFTSATALDWRLAVFLYLEENLIISAGLVVANVKAKGP